MGQVIHIIHPERTIDAAWQGYCDLVNETRANEAKRTDIAHQQATARAWAHWRDLFLASESV